MRNIKTIALCATIFLAIYSNAFAGQATGTASVSIIRSISTSATRDLSFGEIAVPKFGTVSIALSPEEKTNISGNANYNGSLSSARFEINGEANANYAIVLPSNVQISNGSNSLTLNNFTHSYGNNIGKIKEDGNDVFYVGATLNVSENTTIGFYSGNFAVTVDYQ